MTYYEKENVEVKSNAVVIGNGFDLNLGIKSSYNDFLKYLLASRQLKNTEEIYNFNKLFVQNFNGREINWCDFESIFEKQIIEINQSTSSKELGYTKEFLINQINQDLKKLEILFSEYLEQEFEQWLKNWRYNIEEGTRKVNSFYKKLFEKVETTVISFNYTPSIEVIFPTVKPNHIHGMLEDGNIIFGGGFSGSSLLNDASVKGSTENDKLIRSKKNPKITEQRNRIFDKINNRHFSSLFVLGHSILGSDFVFLKQLFENSNKIYIFYFELDYEEKLQFLIQKLEKKIVERIELVPFFEIDVSEKEIVISREIDGDKDDYTAVRETFDFPIPSDESDIFLNFEISTSSFLLKRLKRIVIDNTVSLKAIYNLLSKLPMEYVNNVPDDFFDISIRGREAYLKHDDISDLFNLELFRKIFEKAEIFELSTCEINLDDLMNLFERNNLRRVKVTNNKVFFSTENYENNHLNLTNLSRLEKIVISENEFIAKEGVSDSKISFPALLTKAVMKNKILEIKNNTNLTVSTSIFIYLEELKEIIISINSIEEGIIELPAIEMLNLYIDENDDVQHIPKLKLNDRIKELHFSNFILNEEIEDNGKEGAYEPLFLSSFFEEGGKKAVLGNIEIVEFENCEIPGTIVVDCFVNLFRNGIFPEIKVDKDYYLFSNFAKDPTHMFGSFVGILLPEKDEILSEKSFNNQSLINSEKNVEYNKGESHFRIKEEDKNQIEISKTEIHSNFAKVFLNNLEIVGELNLEGTKNEILSSIILKTSQILKVSEKHLRDSFKSYKYSNGYIPYISEIVESLELSANEFEGDYGRFVEGKVKFRNRVVIIENVWRKIVETVLLPIGEGEELNEKKYS